MLTSEQGQWAMGGSREQDQAAMQRRQQEPGVAAVDCRQQDVAACPAHALWCISTLRWLTGAAWGCRRDRLMKMWAGSVKYLLHATLPSCCYLKAC
jgi:hypothetical protein